MVLRNQKKLYTFRGKLRNLDEIDEDDLHGHGLLELSEMLYLVHEVAAVHNLHHEIKAVLKRKREVQLQLGGQSDLRSQVMEMTSITRHRLKTAVHLDEERGLVCHGEHPLLDHGALDVVVLDDDVLLQDLDGVQLVGALPLGQHNLRMEGKS